MHSQMAGILKTPAMVFADRGKVSTLAALCTFERLLHVMTHGRLVNLLAAAVLLNVSDGVASPAASMDSPRSAAAEEQHTSSQVTPWEPPCWH